MYEQVKKRLPRLGTVCSQYKFSRWLTEEIVTFGSLTTRRERRTGSAVKGRPLWLFNESIKGKNTLILNLYFGSRITSLNLFFSRRFT